MANTLNLGDGNWATKKDSLLAYNSENNNYKPLPFDFSRGSSATVVNKDGLIETVGSGEPRIDYKDNTKGALLLEPSRTNKITYSEDFTQGYWAKSNTSVTSGFVSPDGTNNAFKLTSNNGGNIISRPSILSNTTHATSIYLKRVSGTGNVSIFKTNGNETIVTLTDEWQRFTDINSVNPSNAYNGVRLYGSNDEILMFGGQLEQGSYATSYIPTEGSTVTRLADVCNNGGNDQVINSTEGVLYAEMSALADDSTNRRITISDNSTSNRVVLGFADTSNTILALVGSSGTQFISTVAISDATLNNKFALKYKQNDFALWVNGIEVATDTSGNAPVNLSTLKIQGSTGFSNFYGNVRELKLYNTALSDSELQALTTI